MTTSVISVENLGKRYMLRHRNRSHNEYKRLSEELVRLLKMTVRLAPVMRSSADDQTSEEFWALRNVSFTLDSGEVLGVIGRNGAGKSTLLKILSRITEPAEGRVRIRGRVASLLEVGTGFHPELTGRENVYLNGAILGMTRSEISGKFDEIVAFADIERFLDTPVKRYSSGMYVRLAFAVAAHLEPEILVVDEVLAVGDADFQKKCLGRIQDVSKSGRTVLFVSHNMAAVQSLCSRCIVLSRGSVAFDGSPTDAVSKYLALTPAASREVDLNHHLERSGNQSVRFVSIRFENDDGEMLADVPMGSALVIALAVESKQSAGAVHVGIVVSDSLGQRVFRVQTLTALGHSLSINGRRTTIRCRIPRLTLVPDSYTVTIGLDSGNDVADHIVNAASFKVSEYDVFGTGHYPTRRGGPCFVDSQWSLESYS